MKYLNFLVLLGLISCSSPIQKKRVDTEAGFQTSGSEQFLLPELPKWINSSAAGACMKSSSFSYMNYPKLKENYQLSYLEAIELQAQYNEKLENYFRSTAERFLRPVEEASFFSNTMEQVRGGVRSLKLPPVTEVEIIWLEGFTEQELRAMGRSERFNERLPILFSSCHSKQSLNQWISAHQLEDVGFYTLSAEWLSPYNAKGELTPGLHLELRELFGKTMKIRLTTSKHKPITELLLP